MADRPTTKELDIVQRGVAERAYEGCSSLSHNLYSPTPSFFITPDCLGDSEHTVGTFVGGGELSRAAVWMGTLGGGVCGECGGQL